MHYTKITNFTNKIYNTRCLEVKQLIYSRARVHTGKILKACIFNMDNVNFNVINNGKIFDIYNKLKL